MTLFHSLSNPEVKMVNRVKKAASVQTRVIIFPGISQCAIDILNQMDPKKVPKKSDEFSALIRSIKDLIKYLKRFRSKSCLKQIQIGQTETELTSLMETIINSFKSFDPQFALTYNPTKEVLISDYQSLNGFLTDPKYSNDQSIVKKINELSRYLRDLGAPGSNAKRKTQSAKSLAVDSSLDTDYLEEFQDLTNIDKYKLSKNDYEKEPAHFKNLNNQVIYYHGKMKETNLPITVMEIQYADIDKFKRLYSLLTALKHPSLEIFKGASFSEPYEIVTLQIGESLHEIIPRGYNADSSVIEIGPGDRTMIAYKIAEGMAYLHSNRIIHRNLNSSNIMIDENKNPRIVNFAYSRFMPENSYSLTKLRYSQSTFTAPELLTEECTYDESVDVFSYAGILYELLTGNVPFSDDSKNMRQHILNGERPQIPDSCPADLKELIALCWNQNPKNRPSFAWIIDHMLTNRITIPNDSKADLEAFYDAHSVKTQSLKNCLDCLKKIFDAINYSYVCTQELIRVRSILYSYFFLLQTSELEQNQKDLMVGQELTNLQISLELLYQTIVQTSESRWTKIAVGWPAIQLTTEIYNLMGDIYVAMTQLNFQGICKYEYVKNDLLYDFRFMYEIFRMSLKRYPDLVNQMEEIQTFLDQFHLKIDVTQSEISQNVRDVLYPFQNSQVDREDFSFDMINNQIGRGTSCIVYKAHQKSTDRDVALKIFNDFYLSDSLPQLKRELAFLISLKNESPKYIVSFIGYNADPGEPLWVITDLYQGGDLFKAKYNLTPFQKTKIMFEIAEGMEYLHSKHILHRDLKTSNILLDGDTPKITDFGFARTDTPLQKTNRIGTYNYMAPEVIVGEDYGPKADVCSYARMLWELYYGEYPFCGLSEDAVQKRIKANVRLSFSKPISADLRTLIESGCNYDENLRPTFTEIIVRMIESQISYPGANPDEIRKFYADKKAQRQGNIQYV